jgi:hypothetical protein
VAKRLINPPKMMITIFWNPVGIHVLAAVTEKTSFDAEYFFDYVLTPNEELFLMRAAAIQKQTPVIRMDNSPMSRSKGAIQKIALMAVTIASHLPYSPDLAPPGFFFLDISSKRLPIKNSCLQKTCSR